MRLMPKLSGAMIIAALVPLGIAGIFLDTVTKKELVEKIEKLFSRTAETGAARVADYIQDTLKGLNVAVGYLDFETMDVQETTGALRLLYSQFPSLNIITLFGPDHTPIVGSVYLADPISAGGILAEHQPVNSSSIERYSQYVPLPAALSEGITTVSKVYLAPETNFPTIAAVIPFKPTGRDELWALAMEITLGPLEKELTDFLVGRNSEIMVIDSDHRRILYAGHLLEDQVKEIPPLDPVLSGTLAASAGNFVKEIENNHARSIIAAASVGELGWYFLVSQTSEIALRAAQSMHRQVIFWLVAGGALAIILGFGFSRTISQPILECSEMARKLGAGDLQAQVQISSRDEIGTLGQTLNMMGVELTGSREKIEVQNIELRRWNEQLENRVAERGAQLKKVQAQLLEAQKMAAIGDLGAGIAHELNNPMVGILGLTQLILEKLSSTDPNYRSLKAVEKEALRCRGIIADLLTFSQKGGGEERAKKDLHTIIERAIGLVERQYSGDGVALEKRLKAATHAVMVAGATIEQVLLQLFSNAKNAMPGGGTITVTTENPEKEVIVIEVRDTGKGIAPEHLGRVFEPFFTTKDNWQGKGLGLSVAYSTIQEHGGTITVESKPEEGAVFTIVLPVVTTTQLI